MRRVFVGIFVFMVTGGLVFASEVGLDPFLLDGVKAGFDSLNVQFVGNWPFGPHSCACAVDTVRDYVFMGSSGGVCILDVSTPSDPVFVGEVHTRGWVEGIFYSYADSILYVADRMGGLEIWDVGDVRAVAKLGSHYTPGNAYDVFVAGDYLVPHLLLLRLGGTIVLVRLMMFLWLGIMRMWRMESCIL